MPTFSEQDAVQRLTKLLDQLRPKDGAIRLIGPDESLPDAGVSSLQMVNLMLAIEADFDVFIPAEDVNPSNFATLSSIAAMLRRLDVSAPS